MKLNIKFVAALLTIILGATVVCDAQESESVVVGFRCPGGGSNQPRPEILKRLGDVTKKAVAFPQPSYPAKARAAGISGIVSVEVAIDVHSGKVVWARIESGHPLLREAVEKVVCQTRFAPTLINSKPLRVSGIVIYRFALRRRVSPNKSLQRMRG